MRLSLRKKLMPYRSLKNLADDLDLTIPELKKKIRNLERSGSLSLSSLCSGLNPDSEIEMDTVYRLFHDFGRCLVCGHEMGLPKGRDIGWGEFKLCPQCDFSAHDIASYQTRKKAARAQLREMLSQSRKTESVLRARASHSAELENQKRPAQRF